MDAMFAKMINSQEALAQIRSGATWIDVRSESEFAKGALPGALNAPILNDEERRLVGVCYKNQSQQKAVALGHKLVSGATRAARVEHWLQLMNNHKPCGLYCWRGGMRSRLAADWMQDASGSRLPRLQGGYKALRTQLLQLLDDLPTRLDIHLLGGETGSCKTAIIKQLVNAIDLEGLANHRGSAFGAYITPQPTTASFENKLARALLQTDCNQQVWLEDEGSNIGTLHLPTSLKQAMQSASIVIVQEPRNVRVQNIFNEYIVSGWEIFCRHFPDQPLQHFQRHYEAALSRIRNRLGGVKFMQISRLMQQAFKQQVTYDDLEAHKAWVDALLADYYDPMYAYQRQRKNAPTLFTGNRKEVLAFIHHHQQQQQQISKTQEFGS